MNANHLPLWQAIGLSTLPCMRRKRVVRGDKDLAVALVGEHRRLAWGSRRVSHRSDRPATEADRPLPTFVVALPTVEERLK